VHRQEREDPKHCEPHPAEQPKPPSQASATTQILPPAPAPAAPIDKVLQKMAAAGVRNGFRPGRLKQLAARSAA
jgi:hypothetical protein